MTKAGNSATRKSRAPVFLVAGACIVIVVVGVLTNIYRRDSAQTVASPATQAHRVTPAIGPTTARKHIASVAERTSAMTASRKARRAERTQQLEDIRLAAAFRFEQESVDTAWAAGKESKLQSLAENSPTYQQAGILPQSLQIDCRSTLCKVTANHASYGASADWAMIFMTSAAGEVVRIYTKTINNADGTTSVEMFAEAR